jgi:outer membrane immunogenic protein
VTPTSQAISGWRAGGQAGYNYQFHRAVFGFELSGSWDNVSGASSSTLALPALLPNAQSPAACYQLVNLNAIGGAANTYSCQAKQDWSVQALARVGYAIADGRFLPYVTGGVGFTHLTVANSITFVQGFPGAPVQIQNVFGSDKVLLGLIIGGGAQYAFGNGFSIGAEYQYAKYATQDFSSIATSTCVGACGGAGITTHLFPAQESHDLTTNTVRVVLNYKITD